MVEELGGYEGLVLLAGRYEGVDERLLRAQIDDEISIGDYVLSGGELPAMVLMDALVRQHAGRAERRRVGAAGFVRERAAGLPALHAARGLRKRARCRRCCCPATMREIERWRHEAGAGADLAAAPGSAARSCALERGDKQALLEEYKRGASRSSHEAQELTK